MGTNYYIDVVKKDARWPSEMEELHIGKSSGGWCFSLHVLPEEGINTLEDWKELFARTNAVIRDEYGSIISREEMLDTITNRSWQRRPFVPDSYYTSEAHFLSVNHAEYGPNGLLRHVCDNGHCVGHGEGTWDYITGEFS